MIIDEGLLRDCYDAIVVGAGLGGLTAASLLAKRGLSVLIIDQQNKPGGSCTSFKRDDVVFDVGTAMLYGFGEKGFKPFRFLMNELEEPIEIIAHATLARMLFEGQEIIFWPDVARFQEELYRLFPDEKDGIRAFYRDLYKLYENIVIKNEVVVPPSEFSNRQLLRRVRTTGFSLLKMQKLLSTSVKSLLDKYFHSEEIINFYDKLCSAYCYTTAAETPAVLAATMFLDNHIGGVYYPAGGAQMLPNKIEKAFERYGGQTLYRRLVDEILISDGKAYGVRLEDGLEIQASQVIANTTVWNIYGKLVRPDHITPERLAWVKSLVPTYPSMVLYMIVERAALPEDILPWEIFIENRQVIDSSDLTLYINSLVDHTLEPQGRLVIQAIAPNLAAWPTPGDPQYGTLSYQAQKQREAEKMLDQIESHFPGFRQHIRSLIIGTPTTIERYLLKNGGAVGGPKNQIGQEMLYRLHARSEWKNLYFCGDSTVMATGAPATVVSGVGAANMALRDRHMPEYDSRKFDRQAVHFVEIPYKRPAHHRQDPITLINAHLAAAECQWCEEPQCTAMCPAGIDIPGFLRRIESGNLTGAAQVIRQRSPFGEVCGFTCDADRYCQGSCYRNEFAGAPVRIAELERWVCQAAGDLGWPKPAAPHNEGCIAIVGGSVAGLSCAWFLGQLGYVVDIYDPAFTPEANLIQAAGRRSLPLEAIERDLSGITRKNIVYYGENAMERVSDFETFADCHDAVFLTINLSGDRSITTGGAFARRPDIFTGGEQDNPGQTIAQAVADGRRAAREISQRLADQHLQTSKIPGGQKK